MAGVTRAPQKTAEQTKELVEAACEHIGNGLSHKNAATKVGVTASWLFARLTSPEHEQAYARARAVRASGHADKVGSIVRKVERGEIAPDAARVVIDGSKWLASRHDQKRYGDKMQSEITGKDGGPIQQQVTDLSKLSDAELDSLQKLASKAAGANSKG